MNDVLQSPGAPPSSTGTTVRLEPVTETIIVPVPWYKRMFGGPITRTETVWKLTFLSLIVVGIIVGQSMLQTPSNTVTQAAAGTARVSIYPQNTQIPPDKKFQLWITPDKPIREASIQLKFDPTVLALNQDVEVTNFQGYKSTATAKNSANASGVIEIKVVPQNAATPPLSGTKQLAAFSLSLVKKENVSSTSLSIDESNTGVIDENSVPFVISTTNVLITVK